MRGFARFGAGDGGLNGGFTRIDRGRSFSGSFTFGRGSGVFNLLRGFTRFGAGDSGLNGGFTRIACIGCRFNSGLLFSFARPGLGFTRFAGGNRFAVVWFAAGLNNNRLRRITLLITHAGQRGVNGILIFRRRLYGCFFVPLLARGFFTFKTRLSRFKPSFRLGGALFFLTDGGNFRFFLAEVLHQRNITRTDPGAGAAFDAVG